jgi:hypothetical protein
MRPGVACSQCPVSAEKLPQFVGFSKCNYPAARADPILGAAAVMFAPAEGRKRRAARKAPPFRRHQPAGRAEHDYGDSLAGAHHLSWNEPTGQAGRRDSLLDAPSPLYR